MLDWLNNFDLGRWWIVAIAVVTCPGSSDHSPVLSG